MLTDVRCSPFISLILACSNTIQLWSYENPKVMPAFVKILKVRLASVRADPTKQSLCRSLITSCATRQVLYSQDVISDQAIIYWHAKGAKPQAKQNFLKAAEPLVNFLKEQDDDDESDDE